MIRSRKGTATGRVDLRGASRRAIFDVVSLPHHRNLCLTARGSIRWA